MEYEKLIRERKSTRLFSSKEVEQEKIDMILEAARVAPTAKNAQPIKIYVVNSKDGIDKLDKATKCRYKAPLVFIVCADIEKAFRRGEYSSWEMDASIVTTHMMLEATNIGLDNIWIGLFDEEVLRNEFSIPNNYHVASLLPVGYKSKLCPLSPFHKIRKKLSDIVEYK